MTRAPQPLDSLECPHCGESFPITTALQQQLIAPLRMEPEAEAAGKAAALTKREAGEGVEAAHVCSWVAPL